VTATAIDRTYRQTDVGGRWELRVEAPGPAFVADARRQGRAWVVTVRGELDIATVPLLVTVLGTVRDRLPPRVELDLSGVTFVDCYALETLVASQSELPAGRRLRLRDPSPIVTRVLTLTGLDTVFEVTGASPALDPAARRASGSAVAEHRVRNRHGAAPDRAAAARTPCDSSSWTDTAGDELHCGPSSVSAVDARAVHRRDVQIAVPSFMTTSGASRQGPQSQYDHLRLCGSS
jgi:anti-anti-sigma factor